MQTEEPYYGIAEPPATQSLDKTRAAASACKACHLWRHATQTVFGEGDKSAPLLFVGEQPGDKEDIEGRPFVGPAGRIFERALEIAGISREDAYVTNAVKHFKWVQKGSRRIHSKPNRYEIQACIPWLEKEIEIIEPNLIVALGATAAQALLGSAFRVTQERGKLLESKYGNIIATVHPSSILRAQDEEREAEFKLFAKDLTAARKFLEQATESVKVRG